MPENSSRKLGMATFTIEPSTPTRNMANPATAKASQDLRVIVESVIHKL